MVYNNKYPKKQGYPYCEASMWDREESTQTQVEGVGSNL